MERRRNDKAKLEPLAVLKEMPALVVLERFPVPVLAIAEDGSIVFANSAFAEMLGYSPEEMLSLRFHQVFRAAQADQAAMTIVRQHADLVVELVHRDASIRQARMSKSALVREDDPVALAAFHDVTEKMWSEKV
jgi:PAS domain S-box-containing protein